jgi:two-component system response regulator
MKSFEDIGENKSMSSAGKKFHGKSLEVEGKMDSKPILIVEDYEDDAKLLQLLLKDCGIVSPIRMSFSAEDAINYLGGVPPFSNRSTSPLPAVVFVDLKLPGISGFELLRWMKNHPELKDIFVVVLSATGDLISVQAAYALGANSFLIKPCRPADLENLIICYPAIWNRTAPFIVPPREEPPPPMPTASG